MATVSSRHDRNALLMISMMWSPKQDDIMENISQGPKLEGKTPRN